MTQHTSKHNKTVKKLALLMAIVSLTSCSKPPEPSSEAASVAQGKPVVYQVFTRLFGNKNTTNIPWGTKEQNGVGKFADFDDKALGYIKQLGTTHVWYTGVLHHALVADYSDIGISNDDPDVVKGRAGSPYAIKDYYNVNPDLALEPVNRLAEFEALIARTHQHDLKVVIDIVPNHIARNYQSISKPNAQRDFGADDKTSLEYSKNNNFYYVPGQAFAVPEPLDGYQPLGGQAHPLIDGKFNEFPAKWTGNGARQAQPHFHDWYETVKVNYGVKPDGSYDFPLLPAQFATQSYQAHYAFWQQHQLPDSWYKFRDIAYYWLDKGVDGFRYDMAEMVPVEFWSFLNSAIKMKNPNAFILAEVYNPDLYRPYIQLGKMDYLYDKVGFYDTLKGMMQGMQPSQDLIDVYQSVADIEPHLMHFLENHDEQRIASPEFAGDAQLGKPAMVVSTLIGTAPTMLYFGQEVGEKGAENAGFGKLSRASIFDYIGVPAHQRVMNNGLFDAGQSSSDERQLLGFYRTLLGLSPLPAISQGQYVALNQFITDLPASDKRNVLLFSRFTNEQQLLVISNFSKSEAQSVQVSGLQALIAKWQLPDGEYQLKDILGFYQSVLSVKQGQAEFGIHLAPLDSAVLELQLKNKGK
jgi:neopullulanase